MIKSKKRNTFEGQIEFSTNGNASIIIEDAEIFIYKKNTLNALPNDIVKVEIFEIKNRYEAKVIKVISRYKKKFIGKVSIKKGTIFVIPDNNKIPVDFYIKGGLIPENNQKVIVELTKWDNTKSPQGKIVEILGYQGDNEVEMNSIMIEYGLPVEFPKKVITESKLISDNITYEEISKRRDFRDITTITIDPNDAKDFDDAISINIINENKYEIGVHIADVTHYIKPDTELDKEAYNRSTSIYLVDRCVPMLPERLSNNICSLNPNEDKLTFSVLFTMDNNAKILDTWIGKTIINSNRRFTYEEAQSIIEGQQDDYSPEIRILNKLAKKTRNQRIKEGSIEMGGIEVKFELDPINKKPIGVYFKEQKEANKLIEEFMLLANKTVAKYIKTKLGFCVNRSHGTPDMDKIMEIKNICDKMGYNFDVSIDTDDDNIKTSINNLIKEIKDTPEENMISNLIIKSQKKAYYTTDDVGHYGLGFKDYSHFTSPIRRFLDCQSHRLLSHILTNDKLMKINRNELNNICKYISNREIVAKKAERDSIKYKQVEFLSDKIGNSYDGIVSGVTDWGIYVELINNKCEGLIRYDNSNWKVDTEKFIAYNNKYKIRLGDCITVVVNSTNIEKKQIDFTIYES